ncbi:hypothetical protein A2U01_0087921, partial [Trifolium medium]|nr:hypothetical protein [Trifolium medium]
VAPLLLRRLGIASVNCAPRRRRWRVAPGSWIDGSGRLSHLRVAQLHPARCAASLFITRDAQNRSI